MQDFEGLGVFYLGSQVDPETRVPLDVPLLYKSKDLVTHAVCIGMTGSGKTGLCIGLLEEAAIDGIPAIVIDPKGDLPNLLLTFPQLRPEDFRPWISEDEARVKGLSFDSLAAEQAALWQKGLASSGQDGARIQKLKESVEFALYTPGSTAGTPISILRSFEPPPNEAASEAELVRDRISATATSLLALIGINADPVQSREHVLLSNIFDSAWRQRRTLDLPAIISQIQTPPFQRAGVMDLETFYPAKDRFSLAMSFNNLLASPGFQSWLEGPPMDIGALLYGAEGKPKMSILSIAHLSEPERMFFIALLLNQILGWVRAQPGTSSLRAVLYMDEIFGFLPPVANPPAKKPLLTLLKQARASGLGIVLATQNPVDLDYKGLSNTGTWFIGRLQTERDKMRVLDGLESAAGDSHAVFDRSTIEKTIASLGNRTFLLNNVHESGVQLFQTRWTLSYLRGPMTREQIRMLAASSPQPTAATPTREQTMHDIAAMNGLLPSPPVLPPEIAQYFLPVTRPGNPVYKPVLLGAAKLRYVDPKQSLVEERNALAIVPLRHSVTTVDWDSAALAECCLDELEKEPVSGAQFESLPDAALQAKNYSNWSKAFSTWFFQTQTLQLFESRVLGERSRPGESERDFRIRLQQKAREERDRVAELLRQKYAPKMAALEERRRRAEIFAGQQKAQQAQAVLQTALTVGSGLLTAFLGKKALSGSTVNKAATAARQAGRSWKESQDAAQAAESLEKVIRQTEELQKQFEDELAAKQSDIDTSLEEFEAVTLRPKKSDIELQLVALGWAPT